MTTIKSEIKSQIKESGLRVSAEALSKLEEKVRLDMEQRTSAAKLVCLKNKRRTILPQDLEVNPAGLENKSEEEGGYLSAPCR